MTISEFRSLSDYDKYDLTFNKGVFIEYFIKGHQRYALYSLYKFYVEVEYDVTANKIKKLISFEDGKLLSKYSFLR